MYDGKIESTYVYNYIYIIIIIIFIEHQAK